MNGAAAAISEAPLAQDKALAFILAGNAIFTLRSEKTGTRYTFKFRKAEPREGQQNAPEMWFVNLLTGPSNDADYQYLGKFQNGRFSLTRASKMAADAKPVVAIRWFAELLAAGRQPQNVEVWHAGRCGKCGRMLTVPESIESGIGPVCAAGGRD